MKTTEKEISGNDQTPEKFTIKNKTTSSLRSARPSKSMVRIKSLKPKRITTINAVRKKSSN